MYLARALVAFSGQGETALRLREYPVRVHEASAIRCPGWMSLSTVSSKIDEIALSLLAPAALFKRRLRLHSAVKSQ